MTDFQANYEQMTDDELLDIAADQQELVEDAARALAAEMQKRGLKQGQASKFRRNVERLKARDAVGRIGISFRGYGKQFIGALNYAADESSGYEEFDSTLWGFVMFLPLLPLPTVRIRRRLRGRSVFWSFGSTDYTTMESRGIDFSQVALTYAATCVGCLLAWQGLRLVFPFVFR
jgi:hypothetical protein